MKRKICFLLLCICLFLQLCACGGEKSAPTTVTTNATEQTATSEVITTEAEKTEESAPEVSEVPQETEPEFDPSLGIVIMGQNDSLQEPVVICDDDNVKITFMDSNLHFDSDAYVDLCLFEPTYTVENKSGDTVTVNVEFPVENPEAQGIYMYYRYESSLLEVPAGETVSFSAEAIMLTIVDNHERSPKRYADYSQVPMLFIINEQTEVRATVMALTIGGPYEDESEVDYTGKFTLEFAGEPYIRQTAKNPDYFTYAVDILFTNNSEETYFLNFGTQVAPGETVTIQSDIAHESQNQNELDPHQEYSVTVCDEDGRILTQVKITY